MNLSRALALLLALAALWPMLPARAQVAVPPLQARVTDLTDTLSSDQSNALEAKLAQFEQAKGSQIAVLIVPTTQPETIEEYGIRVGDQWKLGRKGVDDGAILIVAKNDHRVRIEVGYGLEGALTDATSKRIISEIITPQFKQGQFYEGIDAGVDRMIGVVNGEPLPPPPPGHRRGAHNDDSGGGIFIALFFFAYVIGKILRRVFGLLPAALMIGAGVGVVTQLVSGVLILGVFAGIASGVIALVVLGISAGVGPGGGFGGGGFGGGSFGGGGGFSGGGGGFGGGGASGDR